MATFIAISAGTQTVEELDAHRIYGVARGTVIRSLDGKVRVVVWSTVNDGILFDQLAILESEAIIADQAKDFAGVAHLIERYMP